MTKIRQQSLKLETIYEKKDSLRDKKLRDWLKRGGREGTKKDFLTLLKRPY